MNTRRNFLTGAASLAALAVTPTLAALPKSERARIDDMIRSGLMERQIFLIPDPEPLVLRAIGREVVIRDCVFEWQVPRRDLLIRFEGGDWVMQGCYLDGGGSYFTPEQRRWLRTEWVRTTNGTAEREALVRRWREMLDGASAMYRVDDEISIDRWKWGEEVFL